MLYCIIIVVLAVGLCILYSLYYNYPRNVSFESTIEIQKPHKEFDLSFFIGFHYVDSKDRLMFWMVDYFEKTLACIRDDLKGYDSLYVEQLSQQLDFKKYDYIITYQKQLNALRHSPFLTKTEDGLYFDKKTPLIPTFDTVITDKVYIYRIKKSNKYRAFGP